MTRSKYKTYKNELHIVSLVFTINIHGNIFAIFRENR